MWRIALKFYTALKEEYPELEKKFFFGDDDFSSVNFHSENFRVVIFLGFPMFSLVKLTKEILGKSNSNIFGAKIYRRKLNITKKNIAPAWVQCKILERSATLC